jgi:hypothetical protein
VHETDVVPVSSINYNNVAGNFQMVKRSNPNESLYCGPGYGAEQQKNQTLLANQTRGVKRGEKI